MKMKLLIISFLALLFCSNAMASEINFIYEKGFVIIPGKVKKEISAEFILYPTSELSYVNLALTQKYKIPTSYTGVGDITGKNDQIAFFSQITDIVIGDEKPFSLFMEASPLEEIKKSAGREIFGILGNDFFKDKITRIDFQKKTINFLTKEELQENSKNPKSSFRFTCKMSRLTENKFGKTVILPVCNEVEVNGKKLKILFDQSSRVPITLLPNAIKELGLQNPEKSETKQTQVKSLKFLDYELNEMPGLILGKDLIPENYKKGIDAVIGVNILQNFVVTYDFKNKEIILEK